MKMILKALVGTLLIFPLSACGEDETPMDRSNIAVSYFYDYAELAGSNTTDCAESDICKDGLLVRTSHQGTYYVPANIVLEFGKAVSRLDHNIQDAREIKKNDLRQRTLERYTEDFFEVLEYGRKILPAVAKQ